MHKSQEGNKTRHSPTLRTAIVVSVFTLLLSHSAPQAYALTRENTNIIRRSQEKIENTKQPRPVNNSTEQHSFATTSFDLDMPHADNEIIIKFDEWTPEDIINETLERIEAVTIRTSGDFNRIRITDNTLESLRETRLVREIREQKKFLERGEINESNTSSTDDLEEIIEILNAFPYIEYAEPNYIVTALEVPNDPYYKFQWNFPLIGVEQAWDTTQGKSVTIAVIDTGIAYERRGRFRQAPDLEDVTFVPGYNFINNSTHPNDDNGHGTHVTGTIAGSTNNNEGVAGIAYKASIMPIKALDYKGSGTYASIADSIRFAADNNADIINLSLGGPASSQTLEDAVKYASEKGVVIVAASGNSGDGYVLYPAAYDEYVLAVGAVRNDKTKTEYSNYGSGLDLVAPGGDIAMDQSGDGQPDGILQQTYKQGYFVNTRKFGYYFFQGTSMSAPHVAGVAALVKSIGISDAQTIAQILTESAEDLNTNGWDPQTGYGLVRADKAVQKAQEFLSSPTESTPSSPDLPNPPNEQSPNLPDEQTPPPPAPEPEPTPEPPVEEEKNILQLVADTYNMFGRPDARFAFWETAFLGMTVSNEQNDPLNNTNITAEVRNSEGLLVAQGSGVTDSRGELFMQLGNFARGTYEITIQAAKEGFETIIKKINFKFR